MPTHLVARFHYTCVGHCLHEHIWLLGIVSKWSLVLWVLAGCSPATPLNLPSSRENMNFLSQLTSAREIMSTFYLEFLKDPYKDSFLSFFHLSSLSFFSLSSLLLRKLNWYSVVRSLVHWFHTLKFSFDSKKYL